MPLVGAGWREAGRQAAPRPIRRTASAARPQHGWPWSLAVVWDGGVVLGCRDRIRARFGRFGRSRPDGAAAAPREEAAYLGALVDPVDLR